MSMKFSIADINSYIASRKMPTLEFEDPENWEKIHVIATRIHDKLWELMEKADPSVVGEMDIRIQCMPQSDGSKGRIFYVKSDMYPMLAKKFPGVTREEARVVVGDGLVEIKD